ncbi:M23 family metallopeptidase [Pedobacter quisquiliarum]|nr:M23 family metallopeptidase [Pedobacter quisquiliarum]
MKRINLILSCCLLLTMILASCKTGPVNLFKTASPYELYQRKLSSAGLDKTAMGKAWIDAGQNSIAKALRIQVPYKEQGYFPAERVAATAFRFDVVRGQRLNIRLEKTPAADFMVYMDLWAFREGNSPKAIASADTLNASITVDVDENAEYLLRLQPELLKSGAYTLEIVSGPSLSFPVKTSGRKRIESLFGVGRDANTRRHEGIDIFGPKLTPVVASADGVVTRVGENNLGGLVVMMRPNGKNYTLYYAHLDKQLAVEGQQVKTGDTLGLMGNTGNASTTPPHLHFGIYTGGGAIDPLPFVNTDVATPKAITAATTNINATLRNSSKVSLRESPDSKALTLKTLEPSTIMLVEAATSSWYKATLPDGTTGYLPGKGLNQVNTGIRNIELKTSQLALYDAPLTAAPVKKTLDSGSRVNLLGKYEDFLLVKDREDETGWVRAGL